jgi:hypothetical protein
MRCCNAGTHGTKLRGERRTACRLNCDDCVPKCAPSLGSSLAWVAPFRSSGLGRDAIDNQLPSSAALGSSASNRGPAKLAARRTSQSTHCCPSHVCLDWPLHECSAAIRCNRTPQPRCHSKRWERHQTSPLGGFSIRCYRRLRRCRRQRCQLVGDTACTAEHAKLAPVRLASVLAGRRVKERSQSDRPVAGLVTTGSYARRRASSHVRRVCPEGRRPKKYQSRALPYQ